MKETSFVPREASLVAKSLKGKDSRKRTGRKQDQDRIGRQQDRDRTGRQQDPDDRDQSDRVQDRPKQDRAGRERLQALKESNWGTAGRSDNRDYTGADTHSNADRPYERYLEQRDRRRTRPVETLRMFSAAADPILPQPCRLCEKSFPSRELWQAHVEA